MSESIQSIVGNVLDFSDTIQNSLEISGMNGKNNFHTLSYDKIVRSYDKIAILFVLFKKMEGR